jgi:ketosteroid isomerase-like protein
MSQEIKEFAERALAAVNETYRTGDMRPWRQHVEETCHRDIVLESSGEAFTEGEWRGRDGVVGFVANQMEVLDDMWLRVDEYLHVEAGLLVAAISFGGRARHTGIEVEMHPLHVFRLHDGKVVWWQVFLDRAKALEAAGLGE